MRNKSLVTLAITDHVNDTTQRTFIVDTSFDSDWFVKNLKECVEQAKQACGLATMVRDFRYQGKPIEVFWSTMFRSYKISKLDINHAQEVDFIGLESK